MAENKVACENNELYTVTYQMTFFSLLNNVNIYTYKMYYSDLIKKSMK